EQRPSTLNGEEGSAAMVGRIFRRPVHRCRIEIGGRNIRHGEEQEAKGQSRSHAITNIGPSAGRAAKFFLLSIVRCLFYLAALIAYYLDNFSPFMVKFGSGFGIRWYGFS